CGSYDRSDRSTGPARHRVCESVQPCIDRRTECLRDGARTADLMQLIMEIAMETHAQQELNLREEPGSGTAHPPSTQADGASAQPSELQVVLREAPANHDQHQLVPETSQALAHRFVARWALRWTSRLATLVMALVAVLVSIVAWHHYVMTPW